jgi:hypothetical protein
MQVWNGPPPSTPIWQNRATALTPRSGVPRPVLPRTEHYQALEGYADGLGFSLKPPKWVRKLTLKKAIVPLAIVGATFLIPGAGALLAKGVLGATKLAFGGVKLAGKGVTGLVKLVSKNVGTTAAVFKAKPATQATQADQTAATQAAQAAAQADQAAAQADQVAQAMARTASYEAPTYQAPNYVSSSTNAAFDPGSTAPTSGSPFDAPAAAATQAGMGSSLVPLAVAGAALLAVTMMQKKGR